MKRMHEVLQEVFNALKSGEADILGTGDDWEIVISNMLDHQEVLMVMKTSKKPGYGSTTIELFVKAQQKDIGSKPGFVIVEAHQDGDRPERTDFQLSQGGEVFHSFAPGTLKFRAMVRLAKKVDKLQFLAETA